ncbi:MAG: hypothetical protein BJ554DRAFT_1009 [Olpidium bornovanus]|uniref:Uncharacterized protein n=1 Tax=Olpidium bornovanus TaxID=278681 RepID=A0A8H8A1G0_9FUNG|nr:MAG: hypothetical protein BJ554DRAFT_1009 [Olpidium bornovanus]
MTDRDGGRVAARGGRGGGRERWASGDAWDSPERHRPDWVHEDRANPFRGSPRRRSPGYEQREQQHHRRMPSGPPQQRYYGPPMAPPARGPSPSSSSYHLPSAVRPWNTAGAGAVPDFHRSYKPLPQQRESFSNRRISPQFPAREGGGLVGGPPLPPSGRGVLYAGPVPVPTGPQPPFKPARPPPPPYAPSPHRRPPFPHTPSHGSAGSFSPSKPQVGKPLQRIAWAPEKEKEACSSSFLRAALFSAPFGRGQSSREGTLPVCHIY